MNLDDVPVGQHTELLIPEHLPEELPPDTHAASNLSLFERLQSKNAKQRFEAFCELLKVFTEAPDFDSIFDTHASFFPKYIGDAHPGAQEKAMDCLLLFLSKSSAKPLSISELLSALVEKGYTSSKTTVKSRASDCLLALAQIENSQIPINDCITTYLSSKNPKVASAAIQALTALLANFGNAVYPIKMAIPLVASQASSTNAGVRTEAMNYFKEAYRWVKEGIFPALSGLKQAQQDELKANCIGMTELVAEPKLFVKGKCVPMTATNILPIKSKVENHKPGPTTTTTVTDLSKFNEGWCDKLLGMKKWSEKRDLLEDVVRALTSEKIKAEGFGELVQCLKKLLSDSNIVVVNLALKCLGLLAAALKGSFSLYAKYAMHTVVQKYKDRKTQNEAQKCMELFVHSLHIEEVLDDIKDTLNDKSPAVKLNMCAWIEKAVLPVATQGIVASLLPAIVKLTDDAAVEVRDAALGCIGAMKASGEYDVVNKAVHEMIPQKQEKVTQVVARLMGKPLATEPKPRPEPMKIDSGVEEKVKSVATVSKPVKKEEKRNAASVNAKPLTAQLKDIKEEDLGPDISEDEAIQNLSEKVPATIIEGLSKPDWKERQQSLQALNQLILTTPALEPQHAESLAKLLRIRLKEFKESNVGIMKEALNILTNTALTSAITKKFAHTITTGLFEKLSEQKLAEPITGLLLAISDSVTPAYVGSLIIKSASACKNPSTIKATLGILGRFITEYTSLLVPLKLMIEFAKHCLSHSNQHVRNTAMTFLCSAYAAVGDSIRPLLILDLKDSILKTLDTELAKTQVKPMSEVTRSLKGEAEKEWNSKKMIKATPIDALLPRTNIAPQITSKILNGLTNPGMKQRQEAKDALDHIIIAANYRIQSNGLSQLFNALKGKMNEPCKNLAKGFITLVGTLASSMGSGVKQYVRIIMQPLLYNLADKQSSIRAETLNSLNKFAEAVGAEHVINSAGPLLEKENPELRTEILGWTLRHREELPKADVGLLIRGLVSCIQDRSREIRSMAEEIIGEIVPLTGHVAFMDAIKDFKPTVKETLKLILDKYKVMVPRFDQIKDEPMEIVQVKEETKTNLQTNYVQKESVSVKMVKPIEEVSSTVEKPQIKNVAPENPLSVIRPDLADLMANPLSSKTLEAIRIVTEKLKVEPKVVIAASTPLFNWISLKLATSFSNTLNKPAGDFLHEIFMAFHQNGVRLTDYDASIVLPVICDKLSNYRETFGVICGIYSPSKLVLYLTKPLEYASPKVQLDCLTNIKEIIVTRGMHAVSEIEPMTFVRFLSSAERELKEEALSVMKELYKLYGESIWTKLTNIMDQHKELLRQTFSPTDSEPAETENLRKSLKKCSISELAEVAITPSKALNQSVKRSVSPLTRKSQSLPKIDSLEQCLYQLKYGEISSKIDALVFIGEKATSAIEGSCNVVAMHCNEVLGTFAEVMKELFNGGFDEVQLRFIKYFMNVANKICSSKSIVYDANESELSKIMEQLLTKLLFDGLERLGSNSEGETLMKCLNSTILRLLENCQPTRVFCVLITLLKSHVSPANSPVSSKLPGLIVKCLLKLTKVIEHLLPNIDLSRLFVTIHEFLLANPSSPAPATPNEEIGSRIIKTIVNEIVKIKREQVWEHYKAVQQHPKQDQHIKRWITVILRSLRNSISNGVLTEAKANVEAVQKSVEKPTEMLAEYRSRLATLQASENRENSGIGASTTASGDIFARIDQFKALMSKTITKKF